MFVPFLVAAALAFQDPAQQARIDSASDTARRSVSVEVRAGTRRNNREPRRVAVTAQHVATAFRTPLARTLLERARFSRMQQDSTLRAYEATAHLRISAGMGFSRIGRDRLLFRHENVTNVSWNRDVGAWIDVKGARTALPMIPDEGQKEAADDVVDDSDIFMVPWYPGQEPLFAFNSSVTQAQVDDRELVHPLAEGAEAYYTYIAGDSMSFRLPDGTVVRLRELRVRPREPKWNVAVGSLWFDLVSGQLVRAAYRLAEPLDIWAMVKEEDPADYEEIPIWVRPMISPMRAQVSAIAVEYGLYQGQFWLPRQRLAEGHAQVSFMRVPFRFEQSYKYASVDQVVPLPEIQVASLPEPPDSLSEAEMEVWRDSVREVRRDERRAEADSVRRGLKEGVGCDSTGMRLITRRDRDANLRVAVRIPCNLETLASSPELPESIYDDGEEIFGSTERDALIKEALAMGAQPPMSIGSVPPRVYYGLEYTRFNRVEGLSTGALVEQTLGGGYTARLLARIGYADLEPNVELGLSRTNLTRTLTLRGYNRLVAANDWGDPLAFGSSLSALLFGRDEGFYHRATGAELEWVRERPTGARFAWRLFAEHQRTAVKEVDRALGPAFIANIDARRGGYAGLASRFSHTKGHDPNGFRLFTDARVEGAVSDSSSAVYGRGALDLTMTQGLGRIAAALTLSGGSSVGPLPAQRRWFLGGAHTVRGQRADTSIAGDAYWLGRLEVGTAVQGFRPVIFGDIGWTGPRALWQDVGRPMSGAGVGASAFDGLIRLDLARGIYPRKRTMLYLYVDAKF
ncbi:MAG: ShlB/FhaC/HecB family hemolysin secretion/activation protein [Gemmatimonadaceae bacterium]